MLSKATARRSGSSLEVLKSDKHKPGLPIPSRKSKDDGANVAALLDSGEADLAKYYEDSHPGHLTDARLHYQAAIKQQSGCPEAHHGLAIVCDLQEDYSTAELHYRAALEGNPNDAKILGDLGYSYLLQGKLNQSEDLLKQATKADPANVQAFKNLAYVYGKTGRAELAQATYRRVLNDSEVRQEMAQLFPQGIPETEHGLFRDTDHTAAQNVALRDRVLDAREQGQAEMRNSLDRASAQGLNPHQQQAEALRLQAEREASHLAQEQQSASNAPIMLDARQGGSGYPHQPMPNQPIMAHAPEAGPNYTPPMISPSLSQPHQTGRRVQNSLYPQGGDPRMIQQAGATQPLQGGYPHIERALHQTPYGVDPRTGLPLQQGIQQAGDTQPLVPQDLGGGHPNSGTFLNGPSTGATPPGPTNPGFEEAKRRAAMVGLAGPESMFPIVEGTQRVAPGTGSTLGADYPPIQRYLPTNAQPHDLQDIYRAPSGQMTVPPNQLGMVNSPAGPRFADPPAYQTTNADGPAPLSSWNSGMSYQDQASAAQHAGHITPQYPHPRQPNGQYPPPDARQSVNAELYRYGETMQPNTTQRGQTAWGTVNTPSEGVRQQYPQPQTGGDQMRSSWNPQTFAPQMVPPPYPGSPAAEEQGAAIHPQGANTQHSNTQGSVDHQRPPNSDPTNYSPATDRVPNEPAPIYSPGVRVPAPYYPQSNSAAPANGDHGHYNGPRIRPAAR